MYSKVAVLGLAATAMAKAIPQGVTGDITPTAPAPAGCATSYAGSFQITTINATTSAHTKRQNSGELLLTLANGQLHNQQGDTGYIASNYQFQFDKPPQDGAIYTGGFSVCQNGSLAIGPSTVFYSCNSGGFNNLYNENWAPQCSPVYINVIPTDGGSDPSTGVTQTADGQPQAQTTAGVTQISDHQPQAPTTAPLPVITVISDHQPQAPATALTANPITQISDHQIQAPTGAPITQISDHQPQAPTGAPAPVITQISDHQIQAPTGVVSQISDHQVQAPTPAQTPSQYTGAAAAPTGYANFALAGAAVIGAALL